MAHHNSGKTRSKRQLQVGEMLKQVLAEKFSRGEFYNSEDGNGSFPPLTITEVRVSPDLRNATVFVMPLAGKDQQPVLESLNRIDPQIRRELSGKLRLKFLPHFSFRLDDTYDRAARMETLFKQSHALEDASPDTQD
ncbi:MAG: ribosome-binding factor A [Hyphomicrobiales bacterium]|nr:ribosome-binding factor A [Hyphomicrobiales bacterium]